MHERETVIAADTSHLLFTPDIVPDSPDNDPAWQQFLPISNQSHSTLQKMTVSLITSYTSEPFLGYAPSARFNMPRSIANPRAGYPPSPEGTTTQITSIPVKENSRSSEPYYSTLNEIG